MDTKEIAEVITALATEKGVSAEEVVKKIERSLVTLDSLEFSVRTKNVLAASEIKSVEELRSYSAEELKALPLGSKKMVLEIESVLASRGLTLK